MSTNNITRPLYFWHFFKLVVMFSDSEFIRAKLKGLYLRILSFLLLIIPDWKKTALR